jgi:DeoR family suf operon transcriptional repressor
MTMEYPMKKRATRDVILHGIKSSPHSTVEELAEVADVSPVTVRHHLNALLAAGAIEAASVRRKVGRPYYVYSLSEQGQELFPKRYVRLTNRLLDQMKDRLPQALIDEIFAGVVDNVLEEHRGEFEHLPLEGRLEYLVNLLAEEGSYRRGRRPTPASAWSNTVALIYPSALPTLRSAPLTKS